MRFVWLLALVGCHREAAPVAVAKPVAVVPPAARVIPVPKLAEATDELAVAINGPAPEVPPEPDYAEAFAMADRFGGAVVIGHVSDDRTGEPLAGVTVLATLDGNAQAAITDELGAYRLDLPRGGYTFAFYYADYTATHDLDVRGSIAIDETIDQSYHARPPVIDPESTSEGVTFDDDYLVNIPMPARTFDEALGAAADEQGDDQIE